MTNGKHRARWLADIISETRGGAGTLPDRDHPMRIDEPTYRLRKSAFGLKNKAHDFEDATWAWVTKRGPPDRRGRAICGNIALTVSGSMSGPGAHSPTIQTSPSTSHPTRKA